MPAEGQPPYEIHEELRAAISRLTGGSVQLSNTWGLDTLHYGRTAKDDPSSRAIVEVYISKLGVGWCPTLDDHWVDAEFATPEWRYKKRND